MTSESPCCTIPEPDIRFVHQRMHQNTEIIVTHTHTHTPQAQLQIRNISH